MDVVLYGATGMVGSGVLIECLEDDRVRSVLAVGRRACGVAHEKLRELVRPDLMDHGDVMSELGGRAACFFCLGVSSAGMSEAAYRRVTYDLTIAAAEAFMEVNPGSTFCFVSGQGTDSTERGRFMWARVKGATENRLLGMGPSTFMFRPGFIQPLKGVRSKTRLYRLFYGLTGPAFPLLARLAPGQVTTTVRVGRAMIRVVADGYPKRVLETTDINALGTGGGTG